MESLLAGELRGLGAGDVRQARAGVAFSGELETAYRVCLWSRLASRILVPLLEGARTTATSSTRPRSAWPGTSTWRERHPGRRLHRRDARDPRHPLRRGARQGRHRRPVPRAPRRPAAIGGRPRARHARQRAPGARARDAVARPERREPAPPRLPRRQGAGGGAAQGEPGGRRAAVRGVAAPGGGRRQLPRSAVRVRHAAHRGRADRGRRRARPAARRARRDGFGFARWLGHDAGLWGELVWRRASGERPG